MFAVTSSAPFAHQHQQPQHHQSSYQQTKLPALASSVSFGAASGSEGRSLPPPPLALGSAPAGPTQSGVLPSPAAHFYSHHYGPSTASMTSPAAVNDNKSSSFGSENLEQKPSGAPVKAETGDAAATADCRSAPATSSTFPRANLDSGAGNATGINSLLDEPRRNIDSTLPAAETVTSLTEQLERASSRVGNPDAASSSTSPESPSWARNSATSSGLAVSSQPGTMSSSSYHSNGAGNLAPSGLPGSISGPSTVGQPGSTRLSGDSGRFAFYPSDSSSSGHPRDTNNSGSSSSAWDQTQSTTPITPYGPAPPQSSHSVVDPNTPSTATTNGAYAQHRGSTGYYPTHPSNSLAQQAHQSFGSERPDTSAHPLWAASAPNSPEVPHTASAPSTSHGYPQGQPRGLPASYVARPSYGQSVARISTPTYASMATGGPSGAGGGGPFTAGPAGPVSSYMGASTGLYHNSDMMHGQLSSGHQRMYAPQQSVPQTANAVYNAQHFGSPYGHSAPFSSGSYAGQPGIMGMQAPHPPHTAPLPSDPIIQDSYGNTVEFRTHYFNPFEVKHRRRTTKAQFKVLEGTFKETPKPTAAVRKHIAEELNMPTRAVQIWFQNRRAKAKASAKKEQEKVKKDGGAPGDAKAGQASGDSAGNGTSAATDGSAQHRPSGSSLSFDGSFAHSSSSVSATAYQPHDSSASSASAASHSQGGGLYGERSSFSGPSTASFYPDAAGSAGAHQGGGSASNTPRYAPPYQPSEGSWRSYQ